MAMLSNSSRFALLDDDAADPFESKTKKKRSGSNSKAKKNAKKAEDNKNVPAANKDQKELMALAFGGGKKKKNKSNGGNATAATVGSSSSPKAEQYEDWKQRDVEFVSGSFESDMEAALLQSKLDLKSQQIKNAQEEQKPKSRKKPVPMSLSEFNSAISKPNNQVLGAGVSQQGFSGDAQVPVLPEEEIERLRQEAQMEAKRELQMEANREMFRARIAPPPSLPIPVTLDETLRELEYRNRLAEKDDIIERLVKQNQEMEAEIVLQKTRYKKLLTLMTDAKLKGSVVLASEIEKLNLLNQQFTEEITSLHSQLEQERSKAHAAQTECRKLERSRRRTASSSEMN